MFTPSVLNLLVTMRTGRIWLFLLISLTWIFQTAGAPADGSALFADKPKVDSPRPGDLLQGVVAVIGSTDIPDFQSVETAFSYDEDGAAWYVLEQRKTPDQHAQLASWDTTTITDGQYRLRVTVHLENGTVSETIVAGLRVRNYTAVETETPAPAAGAGAPVVENTLPVERTITVSPSVTAMPINPAEVTQRGLMSSGVQGAGVVVAAFALLGAYTGLRSLRRRSGRRN